jgi:lipoprotein-releasing system permease protein
MVPLIVGASLCALAVIFAVGASIAERYALELAFRGDADLPMTLKYAATGAIALGSIVLVFGLFNRFYAMFTALSITGVFVGSAAMVIFLSVMSGFEGDLKTKILGANAHIIITRESGAFLQADPALHQLDGLDQSLVRSPYLSSEVMALSPSNQGGALLKGIEPSSIVKVTDLREWLKRKESSGSLDYLEHPEKLRNMGLLFSPIAREPLLGRSEEPRAQDGGPASPRFAPVPEAAKAPRPAASGPALAGAGAFAGAASPPGSAPASQGAAPPRRLLPGILIGREMAKNLRLYVGDDVNIVCPMCGVGPTGPIAKSKPFRVAGIFYSGMYEYDMKYAYVLLSEAQKFLETEDEITGVEIKVDDFQHADKLAAVIRGRLGPTYDVKDWKEMNRSLFSALFIEKITMFIVLAMIILVASLCIIATLIMLVTAKAREIAILKSMGARDRSVLSIFLLEGLYIGGQGMIIGVLSGIAGCLGLRTLDLKADVYYISKLPVQLQGFELLLIAVAAIGISMVFTAYPAWLASRMQPVEGLRYE